MCIKAIVSIYLCLMVAILLSGNLALGGSNVELYEITDEISPIEPNRPIGAIIGLRWDPRCIPIPFRVNNALDPIPNPEGEDFLAVADAIPVLQESMKVWNDIPTSFIAMEIIGTVNNPGLRAFDMVNEITFRPTGGFRSFGGRSSSVALVRDRFFLPGNDLDGDGDSDVASGISTCQDVDDDGDIEFPEGFYAAGTIIENDVEINTDQFRITISTEDVGTGSIDLLALANHELGHSIGLGHSRINQISMNDGRSAVMYPFANGDDPFDVLALRTLSTDDIAWASFLYPEGSTASGPGALQSGDIAFNQVYGLITGNVSYSHPFRDLITPLAGANVFAINTENEAVISSAISGTAQCAALFSESVGFLGLPMRCQPNSYTTLDGEYILPVPTGIYKIGMEAFDRFPFPIIDQQAQATRGTLTAISGLFLQDFIEEFYDGETESDFELQPHKAVDVEATAGDSVDNINLITNKVFHFSNFLVNFSTFNLDLQTGVSPPPGRFYAILIPAEDVLLKLSGVARDGILQGAEWLTRSADSSVVPIFTQAMITSGELRTDGTVLIDLDHPFARVSPFVAQDVDFSPLYVDDPIALSENILNRIGNSSLQHLALVIQLPMETPFQGHRQLAPVLGLHGFIDGVVTGSPSISGLSYISDDGGAHFSSIRNYIREHTNLDGDFDLIYSLFEADSADLRLFSFAVFSDESEDIGDLVTLRIEGQSNTFSSRDVALNSRESQQLFFAYLPSSSLVNICVTSVDAGETPSTSVTIQGRRRVMSGTPSFERISLNMVDETG